MIRFAKAPAKAEIEGLAAALRSPRKPIARLPGHSHAGPPLAYTALPGAPGTPPWREAMSQAERPRPQSKVREFIEGFTDQPGLSGSPSGAFTAVLVNQVAGAIFQGPKPDREMVGALQEAALTAMRGIAPADPLEGMLAAQMVAVHEAAMEAFRRAALAEQTFAGRELGLKYADKLVRSFAALTDALNRHRGKGQQLVRVEHVHVHPGGQAIVGAVTQGGGGGHQENEDQPHAPGSIAHEPEPPLRCPDAQREALPVPGGGRPETLPDARRIPRQRRTGR
jgi:hypothetical protein